MERSPSVLSEELYELAAILDSPRRPRETWARCYGEPVDLGESRFPVIPPTPAQAGIQQLGKLQKRSGVLDLQHAGVDEEIRNRNNLELIPLYDIKQKSVSPPNEFAINPTRPAVLQVEPPAPSQPRTWKEERELHIQNAMARVQQSYVSNVKTLFTPDPRNGDDTTPKYSPKYLDPIKPQNQVIWDEDRFIKARKAKERSQRAYVDEPRPVKYHNRHRETARMDVEMEARRTGIEDQYRSKKYNQTREIYKQMESNRAPDKPCDSRSIANEAQYPPSAQSSRVPLPPMAPARDATCANSYSKRRRKLKGFDEAVSLPCVGEPGTNTRIPAPPPRAQHEMYTADTSYHTTRIARQEQNIDIQNRLSSTSTMNEATTADAATTVPHAPLIPRQVSHNVRSWNSDAAKRGLGFKSKLRKAEEENNNKKPVSASKSQNLTAEARQKWKKATFY